jgi:SAM-dependent methyltransferase
MRDWHARADELATEAISGGEPTAWFDRLYAEGVAGEVDMPWSREAAHPALQEWAHGLDGSGRRALVVGCGLGADAAHLAGLGFDTVGFDLAPTAIAEARRRHASSGAAYVVADLLDLPGEWDAAYDLVFDVYTLQSVPDPPRGEMLAALPRLVAPGGTLLSVQLRRDGTRDPDDGPPFPLARATMRALARDGLELASLEELDGPLWRAELRRP